MLKVEGTNTTFTLCLFRRNLLNVVTTTYFEMKENIWNRFYVLRLFEEEWGTTKQNLDTVR